MPKDFRGASGQEQSCELNRIKSPTDGPSGIEPNPLDLSSFSALTLLVRSFDP